VRLSPERREFAAGLHAALVSRGEVAEAADVARKIEALDAARAAAKESFRPNR
jgi:hypothetical protein